MRYIVDSYESISSEIAEEIRKLYVENPETNLCIAAGHSSLGPLKALTDLYAQGKIDFSRGSFTAMDEWYGMNESIDGSCGDFLNRHFLSKVNYSKENISLVDGLHEPIEEELARMRRFIDVRKGIDYMILGVGMNGHLALNEPGTDFHSRIHVTELDPVTKEVGKKYFSENPKLQGGVTIGIQDMLDTGKLAVVMNGAHKKDIVKRIVDSEETTALPATALKNCDHCCFYFDTEAAALL